MDILGTVLIGSNVMNKHEYVIGDNPPLPSQLRVLANIGARSAAMRDQLRSPKKLNGHYCVDEVDLLNFDTDEADLSRIRHRMAIRIGKKAIDSDVGEKVWSLKYFNRHFVEQDPGEWVSSSVQYSFEWSRRQTLLAQRSVRVVDERQPPIEEKSLGDEILDFHLPDNFSEMWHVRSDYEHVTKEDVDMQIKELSEYYDSIVGADRRASA